MPELQLTVPFPEGVDFQIHGFDPLSLSSVGPPVFNRESLAYSKSRPENQETTIDFVSSSSDFENFSRSVVGGSFSGWGASASAEVTLMEKEDFDISRDILCVAASYHSLVESLKTDKVTLTDTARDVLKKDPQDFLKKYGLFCVLGVVHGGTYTGYLSIETSNQSKKKELQASFKASYQGLFNGEAEAEAEIKSAITKAGASVSGWVGARGAKEFEFGASLDSLKDSYSKFLSQMGSKEKHTGVPLGVVCGRWDLIGDVMDTLGPNSEFPEWYKRLSFVQQDLEQLTVAYSELGFLKKGLDRVKPISYFDSQRRDEISEAIEKAYKAFKGFSIGADLQAFLNQVTLPPETGDEVQRMVEGQFRLVFHRHLDGKFDIEEEVPTVFWLQDDHSEPMTLLKANHGDDKNKTVIQISIKPREGESKERYRIIALWPGQVDWAIGKSRPVDQKSSRSRVVWDLYPEKIYAEVASSVESVQ